ncbi:MAG: flagellar hook-associated protein FlgL [Solirubrobacteraceae bacterium]|nr:flagellar hook-associated protein FlgL [Solirubrobacteraceae bacterium]
MSIPGRVTHNMMSQHLLADIRRSNSEIARTSNEISSQKKITTASDDPTGAHRALRLRAELAENAANQTGVDATLAWTGTTEAALKSVNDIIHRTRELVIQASNDTLQPADRALIAKELTQLVEQVKSSANAKVGDQYVFSGQASGTAPYTAGPVDTYAGDTAAVVRTIGPGQTVQVNVNGDDLFGGTPGDGKLLDTMRTAIANLTTSTPADLASLRGPVLQDLTANLDTLLSARAQIGAVQNRAALADSRLDDVTLAVTDQLSNVEDVDMAEAITRLSSQQTAYQAALSAGANVIQPSLMDFLR